MSESGQRDGEEVSSGSAARKKRQSNALRANLKRRKEFGRARKDANPPQDAEAAEAAEEHE